MFVINILFQDIYDLVFGIGLHNENATLLKVQISATDVKTLNGLGLSDVGSLANNGPTIITQGLD